jgi:hypothetical protein
MSNFISLLVFSFSVYSICQTTGPSRKKDDPGKTGGFIKRKQSLPLITLSLNETRTIDLDSFYEGPYNTYSIEPQFNTSILTTKFTKALSEGNSFDFPYKILAQQFLSNCSAHDLFSGIILTDSGFLLSVNIYDWRSQNPDFHIIDNYTINDNLSCFTFVVYNNSKIILDCRGKNDSKNYFFSVNFLWTNETKLVFLADGANTASDGNNSIFLAHGVSDEQHRSCNRSLKISSDLKIFRFCKSSEVLNISHVIEVFAVEDGQYNLIRVLNPSKVIKGKSVFYIQDLEIFNQNSLYLLDYFDGPFSFQFDTSSDMTLINNFPNILGEYFLDLNFECFGRAGIHNVFQQCKVVVLSSHYITELMVGAEFQDAITLIKR